MTDFWWGFLAGMFIGAWIGFFALAILVGARGDDDARRALEERGVGDRQDHGGE